MSGGPLLVVNAGSTSLKLRVLSASDEVVARSDLSAEERSGALAPFLAEAPAPAAVGHRVVHGGPAFPGPVQLDDGVMGRLEELSELAPLHNPPALEAIAEARTLLPEVPQVAASTPPSTPPCRTPPARGPSPGSGPRTGASAATGSTA